MMLLMELPDCMLHQVLAYVSYDNVAQLRLVSRRFNAICQTLLNIGFLKIQRLIERDKKSVHASLPRRVSQRRSSKMSPLADALVCLEMRLNMLGLTFDEYIHLQMCCFIPGKIIDEVYSIHRKIRSMSAANKSFNAYDLMEELRDLCSMAIGHFEETILPKMKKTFLAAGLRSPFVQCEESDSNETLNQKRNEMMANCEPSPVYEPRPATDSCPLLVQLTKTNDDKYNKIVKKLKTMANKQRLQSRHIRYNGQQIRALKAELFRCRRRLAKAETVQPPSSETNVTTARAALIDQYAIPAAAVEATPATAFNRRKVFLLRQHGQKRNRDPIVRLANVKRSRVEVFAGDDISSASD